MTPPPKTEETPACVKWLSAIPIVLCGEPIKRSDLCDVRLGEESYWRDTSHACGRQEFHKVHRGQWRHDFHAGWKHVAKGIKHEAKGAPDDPRGARGRRSRMTYQQYRRTQIAEMADWHEDFDMTDVSVSAEDAKAGSPKMGDKIARNPANHADRWLVAAAYFAENFEPMTCYEDEAILWGEDRHDLCWPIDDLWMLQEAR